MRLRVKEAASKGHMVDGELYGPGEELPGEFEQVPAGLESRLEGVDDPAPLPQPVLLPAPQSPLTPVPAAESAIESNEELEAPDQEQHQMETPEESSERKAEALERRRSSGRTAPLPGFGHETSASGGGSGGENSEWYRQEASARGKRRLSADDLREIGTNRGVDLSQTTSRDEMLAQIDRTQQP